MKVLRMLEDTFAMVLAEFVAIAEVARSVVEVRLEQKVCGIMVAIALIMLRKA